MPTGNETDVSVEVSVSDSDSTENESGNGFSDRHSENGSDDQEGTDVEGFHEGDGEDDQSETYNLLYDGCPLCEDESVLLVSLFASRHHLSDVAVNDLLKLIFTLPISKQLHQVYL